MENPHKIQVRKKRKDPSQEEVENKVSKKDMNNLSLEDMALEFDIENIHFPDEEHRLQETQQIAVEIAAQEEESFNIQNAQFDKNSIKLVFEGLNQRNKKGKSHFEYDLSKLSASQISKIHKVIDDALHVSIDDLEPQNSKLKEKVKELESTLMTPTILANPLAIAKPRTPDLNLKGSSSLLMVVKKIVEENIKRRISFIMEVWDVSGNIISFRSQLNAYNEFLQKDYKREEGFYKDVGIPFVIKVSNMTKLKTREAYFPSPSKMKQLKACWIKKISNLKDIMDN
jgi:hypothetical protein